MTIQQPKSFAPWIAIIVTLLLFAAHDRLEVGNQLNRIESLQAAQEANLEIIMRSMELVPIRPSNTAAEVQRQVR